MKKAFLIFTILVIAAGVYIDTHLDELRPFLFSLFGDVGETPMPKPMPVTNQNPTRQPLGPPPGSVETSFAPEPNSEVDQILLQTDGKIIICGSFTTVGGARQRCPKFDRHNLA